MFTRVLLKSYSSNTHYTLPHYTSEVTSIFTVIAPTDTWDSYLFLINIAVLVEIAWIMP